MSIVDSCSDNNLLTIMLAEAPELSAVLTMLAHLTQDSTAYRQLEALLDTDGVDAPTASSPNSVTVPSLKCCGITLDSTSYFAVVSVYVDTVTKLRFWLS